MLGKTLFSRRFHHATDEDFNGDGTTGLSKNRKHLALTVMRFKYYFSGRIPIVVFALIVLASVVIYKRDCVCNSASSSCQTPGLSLRIDEPRSDFGSLGVPWCRSKNGESVEWSPEDLIRGLTEFVPIYETRPIKNNRHGMGFDHSFGLWFMTRWLNPVLMIENGAFKGHSTWVLRQAMPETPIITLTPDHPQKFLKKGSGYVDPNCKYFSEKEFIDFGSMDWDRVLEQYGISDRTRILVFFDEHQNQLKRVKQALKAGFKHLIFEDNYDTGTGDHYSFRQICDQSFIKGGGHSCIPDSDESRARSVRKNNLWKSTLSTGQLCGGGEAWWGVRGHMLDDFNRISQAINSTEHIKNGLFAESVLDVYWELPPVAGPSLTNQTRYDPARTSDPIVKDGDHELFERIGLSRFEKSVFDGYTQMVHLQVSQPQN